MPLRLDALTKQESSKFIKWILQNELQSTTDAYARSDKKYFLGLTPIHDANTNMDIGKYIFTFRVNETEKANEIIDIDIVLYNPNYTELEFVQKLEGSSDSNEYYEVVTCGSSHHLVVETVNRHIKDCDILNTKQQVYISAFPFEIHVFNNEKEYNEFFGFNSDIEVENIGLKISGFDTLFTAVSTFFESDNDNDDTPWSIVSGTVVSLKPIVLNFGKINVDAYIIILETALGEIPTLVGKEILGNQPLNVGSIINMSACIKANFVKNNYNEK